jgi:NAD-dependent SIR2 family protein deacetylase
MIAKLATLSQAATPTPFHHLLRTLDRSGKLLRVYTQNIDAIESKCGLSFGVPAFEPRRRNNNSSNINSSVSKDTSGSDPPLSSSQPRQPTPPIETPRCIPLHGTVESLHCQTCTHSYPLSDHLPALASGSPPLCPACLQTAETRALVGKRARGVGRLRPSVVLYNEEHKDGEEVGEVVRKDLMGGGSKCNGGSRSGADLLLVVGTSLKVPGTKRIVREFSKAVHSRLAHKESNGGGNGSSTSPSPSPRRTTPTPENSVSSIYLNFDFPAPTREWEGVFDVWLQGDAQAFAELLAQELEKDVQAKQKRKEREEALLRERQNLDPASIPVKKRKTCTTDPSVPRKKKKTDTSSCMHEQNLTSHFPVTKTKSTVKKKATVKFAVHSPDLSPSDPALSLSSSLSEKLFIRIPPQSGSKAKKPPKLLPPVPEVYIQTLPYHVPPSLSRSSSDSSLTSLSSPDTSDDGDNDSDVISTHFPVPSAHDEDDMRKVFLGGDKVEPQSIKPSSRRVRRPRH